MQCLQPVSGVWGVGACDGSTSTTSRRGWRLRPEVIPANASALFCLLPYLQRLSSKDKPASRVIINT